MAPPSAPNPLATELRHLTEAVTDLRLHFAESLKERSYILQELKHFREEFMLLRVQRAEESEHQRTLAQAIADIRIAQGKLGTELKWRYGILGAAAAVLPPLGVAIYFLVK